MTNSNSEVGWEKEFDDTIGEMILRDPQCGDMPYRDLAGYKKIKSFIASIAAQSRREEREEIAAFLKNVLDGIDIADKQIGNMGGGTKAIRLALISRGIIKHI